MSETTPVGTVPTPSPARPLAIRLTDEHRAQLELLAQLNGRSLTEEIRVGLESWVEASKADPKVLERADATRAEIEREAETKRNAIASILGPAPRTRGKQAEG